MNFNLGKCKYPERDAYDYAWHIYQNIQEMIKLADQKVYVSSTVSLIIDTLVGGIATIVVTDKLKGVFDKIRNDQVLKWLIIILLIAFLCSTVWFIIGALLSLHARGASHDGGYVPNLIFFGHIAARKNTI